MVFVKWIDRHFEEVLLIVFLIIMVLMTGLQVFMRYVANSSLTWSEELNRYCYVWSGFLSIGYCTKKCCGIKIDILLNVLPRVACKAVEIIGCLISIGLFVLFAQAASGIVVKTIASGQLSSALKLPMQYVYSAPLVGFGIGIIRLVQRIILDILELVKGAPNQKGGVTCQ